MVKQTSNWKSNSDEGISSDGETQAIDAVPGLKDALIWMIQREDSDGIFAKDNVTSPNGFSVKKISVFMEEYPELESAVKEFLFLHEIDTHYSNAARNVFQLFQEEIITRQRVKIQTMNGNKTDTTQYSLDDFPELRVELTKIIEEKDVSTTKNDFSVAEIALLIVKHPTLQSAINAFLFYEDFSKGGTTTIHTFHARLLEEIIRQQRQTLQTLEKKGGSSDKHIYLQRKFRKNYQGTLPWQEI